MILLVRVFSIDLYKSKDNGKNILSIEGPHAERVCFDSYECKKYFTVSHLSINDLVQIAQETMENHGTYHKLASTLNF